MKTKKNKDKIIILRCTETEKEYIKYSAHINNFNSISEFIITSSIKPQNIDIKKSKDLIYEINKIGVNLNQITRAVNNYSFDNQEKFYNLINDINNQLSQLIQVHKDLK